MKNIISGLVVLLLLGFSILKFGMRANNLSNSNRALNAERERAKMIQAVENAKQQVSSQLMTTSWIGLVTAAGKDYLTELQFFTPTSGKRIIYLTESGTEGCYIEQILNWGAGGDYYAIRESIPIGVSTGMFTFSNEKCRTDFKNEIATLESIPFNRLTANKNYQTSTIQLDGFSRKEKSNGTVSNTTNVQKVDHKELIAYRKIEKELSQKFESKPGGLSRPQFTISGDMAEVTVNVFGKEEPLGNILLENNKHLFMTNYWEPTNSFSWAGTWKDIRYLDQEGNEKVGDLKFAFKATRKHSWWFKEAK